MYRRNLVEVMGISYKRMEERDVMLDRTLLSSLLFPTKEWRRRMSYRTGPCHRHYRFLQKNGGMGCRTGQDLIIVIVISYKRMEEKDVMLDRTLFSTHLFHTEEWRRRMSSRTGPCQLSMS